MSRYAIIGLLGLATIAASSCSNKASNENPMYKRSLPVNQEVIVITPDQVKDNLPLELRISEGVMPSAISLNEGTTLTSEDEIIETYKETEGINNDPPEEKEKHENKYSLSKLIKKTKARMRTVTEAVKATIEKVKTIKLEALVNTNTEQGKNKDKVDNYAKIEYRPDGKGRTLPIDFDSDDKSCGEDGTKVFIGPKSWRKDTTRKDIIRIFDHLVNNNKGFENEDLCDRLVITNEEVVCYQYECVEGCEIMHHPYALTEIICQDVNSVERYSFKRDKVKSVSIEYWDVSNMQCRVKVGVAQEDDKTETYEFTFVTENEVKKFLELMGPFTKMLKWDGEHTVPSFQYIKEEGQKPTIFPKKRENGSGGYGRVLFAPGEVETVTVVDSYMRDKCPPGQNVAILKTQAEMMDMQTRCRTCNLDADEIIDTYNLLNNYEKQLCDFAVITKDELICSNRTPVVACNGTIEDRPQEGNVRGVMFGLETTGIIPLSQVYDVQVTHPYTTKSGYATATIKWQDSETKQKLEMPFVFERGERMEKFVEIMSQYVK
ncbi:hypothetical protein HN695_05980 [Candidatus Woesearchaeota archaeon]|jgi:hypothetical protein|nr:hypothetical protein [Candidatus Woesearchaeota archaeon]MBT5272570.1 hypothetical protein [Candidatus Woesearchaeota archaeon]MBT6040573.1 hypothetical protein [Candidatus Woesearchaeota archaeon]MBT6337122.1 hypothetical protein [Candidatus Woesearchaeota archaeon]MBT7927858.1 hypothetical protein [Candidatus Woesearchaeota archaeon]